ncbi:hepatic lectin-like [Bolinopsis microptera]|uniref:hepatic lectin-like n=1 Tax=Bolinopsis microptera TaxID=2820187 RepID=UPI00307A4F97
MAPLPGNMAPLPALPLLGNMAPLPLCLPVLLSILTFNNSTVTEQQPHSVRGELMSVYLPRYNTRCEGDSEGALCYDPVSQNFLRCQLNTWTKVYIDKQVPVLAPQDPRDQQIARLTEEVAALKVEMSRDRSDLLHKISSPWCEDQETGWRLHGYQCYYNSLQSQTLLSWERARRFCEARNSSLVSIESSTENEFIAEIAGDVISWIGLKIGPTGGRVWVDDMKSAYNNLQYPVTDNTCVYIDGASGDWYSRDCGNQKTFTCQRSCCGL